MTFIKRQTPPLTWQSVIRSELRNRVNKAVNAKIDIGAVLIDELDDDQLAALRERLDTHLNYKESA